MKKLHLSVLSLFLMITFNNTVNAQGLLDGFTPKKGDASITVSYTSSKYENAYIGAVKMNDLFDTSQNIISLYAKYGISDRVSVILNAPFITADGNDQPSEATFQDISVALKVNAAKFNFKGGNLNLITGLTTHIPTGYETSKLLAVGSGAFGVDFTGGLHLNTDVGFFSTLLASYNLRGDSENNTVSGQDYGVPNSFALNGKLGYASSFIYVEAWASHVNSEEGIDIGSAAFIGNFPETDVDYSSVGITVYKNIIQKVGLSLGYGKIIDGRNVGASTNYSVGLTYNFNQ